MEIINNGIYYSNDQLLKIINKMGLAVLPKKIVICENRKDLFKLININLLLKMLIILDLTVWVGKVEGVYIRFLDVIIIYVFSQTDDDSDFQSKQLYSLHSITHEMRHVWQIKNKFAGNKEKDADKFATKFINKKSEYISKVMNWEDEWEVEEE